MRHNYEMWLTVKSNGKKLRIPVNPETIQISVGTQNTSVSVSGLGEVTILNDPAAKTYEFSSQFPATYGPYCETLKIVDPWTAVKFIEKYMNKYPFRFIVTGTKINTLVSVEDFSYSEQAGDVGTIYYSLKLKQYRIVKPRQITIIQQQPIVVQAAREDTKPKETTYTVVSGDCLTTIARKLGISDWHTIYNANAAMIKDPNLIYPGQVLTIP